MAPIDPCNVNVSLEEVFKLMMEFKDEANGTFVRDDDKMTRNGASIWHMITCGKIPKLVDMEVDEFGMKSISNMTPDQLIISSEQWKTSFNLPSFGVILDDASLFGADLSSSDTAVAMKTAFIAFPMAALQQTISEIHKKAKDKFKMENFPVAHEESENPLKKCMKIQLLMVAIQTRIVLSQEELEKLALEELMIRPNNLGALRRLELTMGTLTKLIEHSKF